MNRANVLQFGVIALFVGALLYKGFQLVGFDASSAGIASEAILVLIVCGWTGSYLLRVFTGKMTFMEQRKRYREAYEKMTSEELRERFDKLSEEQQLQLIKELDDDKNHV